MAEIRKFDPAAGEGIGRLVRDALGETIRPVTPGRSAPEAQPGSDARSESDGTPDDTPSVTSLPGWTANGPVFNF